MWTGRDLPCYAFGKPSYTLHCTSTNVVRHAARPFRKDIIGMKGILLTLTIATAFYSCDKRASMNQEINYTKVFIKDTDTTSTPGILIHGLTLVTKNYQQEEKDALDILALKHKWPLAMKTKNRELFEDILAKDFSFIGEGEFFNRTDYIEDRVKGSWEIDSVKYENMVVQFFGQLALLTYRNALDGTDDDGRPNKEYYSWADIYVKENGRWKILGSHNIEERIEYKNN